MQKFTGQVYYNNVIMDKGNTYNLKEKKAN